MVLDDVDLVDYVSDLESDIFGASLSLTLEVFDFLLLTETTSSSLGGSITTKGCVTPPVLGSYSTVVSSTPCFPAPPCVGVYRSLVDYVSILDYCFFYLLYHVT